MAFGLATVTAMFHIHGCLPTTRVARKDCSTASSLDLPGSLRWEKRRRSYFAVEPLSLHDYFFVGISVFPMGPFWYWHGVPFTC